MSGQRCKHCGANTPYVDWTECEGCMEDRIRGKMREQEIQEQSDAEENERLLLRDYYRDQI